LDFTKSSAPFSTYTFTELGIALYYYTMLFPSRVFLLFEFLPPLGSVVGG
jgi:hypothetical protein